MDKVQFEIVDNEVTVTVPFLVSCHGIFADTPEVAEEGRRVMLWRDDRTGRFRIRIAEKGVLTAGYVIGVEK